MRFLFAFIISASIIGTGIFFYTKNKEQVLVQKRVDNVTTRTEKTLFSQDTDGDGLKDWEEDLWKTDINNKDSDLDGSTDFEEVRAGRDPNKPGPNDLISEETLQTKVNPEIEADLSETDKLSREIFATYAGDKSVGSKPTIGNYSAILYKSMEENGSKPPPKVYNYTDLQVVVTQNPLFLSQYGNNVGKILLFSPEKPVPHELEVFDSAAQNEDPSYFKPYDDIIALYIKTRNDLLETEVPDVLKQDHLLMINGYTAIIDSLPEMRLLLLDPIKAIVGFRTYVDAAENITKAKNSIGLFFKENKISFTQKEDGSLFLSGI